MALQFVTPPTLDDVFINVLLYGRPKTGKSTAAASAPGPVLYLNADRPNATLYAHALYGDAIREARVELDDNNVGALQTLVDATNEVRAGNFRSVVLDPVGEVYRLLVEEGSGRALRPGVQYYGDAGTHLERFCRAMSDLPVNFVMVAHDMTIQDESEGSTVTERVPYTGSNTNPSIGKKLMAMVDIIAYSGVVPPEEEGGQPQYMAQLTAANGRRAGSRFEHILGPMRPLNITEWIEAIKAAGINPHADRQRERQAAAARTEN